MGARAWTLGDHGSSAAGEGGMILRVCRRPACNSVPDHDQVGNSSNLSASDAGACRLTLSPAASQGPIPRTNGVSHAEPVLTPARGGLVSSGCLGASPAYQHTARS